MTTAAEAVGDLVTQACELVERGARLRAADEHAVAEVALLRAEVCALAASCPDEPLAADLEGVVGELDDLLAGLECLDPPLPALTG